MALQTDFRDQRVFFAGSFRKGLTSLPWPRLAWTYPSLTLPHEKIDPGRVLVELRSRIYGIHRQPAPFVMIKDTDTAAVIYIDGRTAEGIPQFDPMSGNVRFDEIPLFTGKAYTGDGHHRDTVDRVSEEIGLLPLLDGQAVVLHQYARFPGEPLSVENLRGPDLVPILSYHEKAKTKPTIEQILATADAGEFVGAKTTMFEAHLKGKLERIWHAQPSLRLPHFFAGTPTSKINDWARAKLRDLSLPQPHIEALIGVKMADGQVLHIETAIARWEAGAALITEVGGLRPEMIDPDTHPLVKAERAKTRSLDRASEVNCAD